MLVDQVQLNVSVRIQWGWADGLWGVNLDLCFLRHVGNIDEEGWQKELSFINDCFEIFCICCG